MGLSEYYEYLRSLSDKELIEAWEDYTLNRESVLDAISYWSCDVAIPIRDIIEERGLADKVVELDKNLIRYTLEIGSVDVPPERLYGEVNPPLEKWWWYLDLIAERQYPAELLPEALRDVYKKFKE